MKGSNKSRRTGTEVGFCFILRRHRRVGGASSLYATNDGGVCVVVVVSLLGIWNWTIGGCVMNQWAFRGITNQRPNIKKSGGKGRSDGGEKMRVNW